MNKLTHFNKNGDVHMVNVGDKPNSQRCAIASGYIQMRASTLSLIITQQHKKGDVLGIARTAGIMAAKQTASLIPLCHPLALTHVEIDLCPNMEAHQILCQTKIKTTGPTGVEMEALVAVQITLLTIYDMCKAVDRGMSIERIMLLEKSGGQSGHWKCPAEI